MPAMKGVITLENSKNVKYVFGMGLFHANY